MSTFTKGLIVFWRTELRPLVRTVMLLTLGGCMFCALVLAVLGSFQGFFWLFSNPVHTPWRLVWLSRGSAMVWFLFIACLLYRHILRLGNSVDHA